MLAALPAHAQDSEGQLWVSASAGTDLGDGSMLALETVERIGGREGGLYDAQIGVAFSHDLSKQVEIAAAYRHTQAYDHGTAGANEERFRQQITVGLGSGFSMRLRTEQRFSSRGGEAGLRVRPALRYTLPVGRFSLNAAHESFVNLNTTAWGQRGGYERMRNSLGLGIPLGKGLSGEIGYLNQYRFGRAGGRDQMDHAATLSISLTL